MFGKVANRLRNHAKQAFLYLLLSKEEVWLSSQHEEDHATDEMLGAG